MARLTSNGKVKAPPSGMPGLHVAWQDLNAWLSGEIPDQRTRLILTRQGNPGDGGGSHSQDWRDGYSLAGHNALYKLHHAFGVNTGAEYKPRPDQGTQKRLGYDAGVAAIQIIIASI